MIQVGGLRPFFSKKKEKVVNIFKYDFPVHYKTLKEFFNNIEEDIKKVPEEERYNLFYTIAHHLEKERTFSSWKAQEVIPFDLDGIDLDRINEYHEVVARGAGFDISKTAIIHTGNGIHILVQVPLITDKEYIKNAKLGYKQVYDRIVIACNEAGLPITKDTTAWDYARIFRVPFTRNEKEKEGVKVVKHCRLIQNNLEVQDFKLPFIEKTNADLFLAKGSFPLPDASYITKSCEFFKWLEMHPEEVHEPHAYAMLSITGHFDDNNETSKRYWSKFSSPSINSKDVTEFTAQALMSSGPRTCQGINDLYGKCNLCPNYNKVTSPIMLKGATFIGSAHCGFTLRAKNGSLLRQYSDLLQYYDNKVNHKSIGAIKKVYGFTGTHYKIIDPIEIRNFAYEHFIPISKSQERAEFLGLVVDSNYVGEDFLDSSTTKGYINFKNGVLNIATGELLPHDQEKYFLYCLPYNYDPSATCPTFDSFLEDITLNRKDLADILLEYLGYIISGTNYKYQKALILSGSGKNGKSTFINLVRALTGKENCSSISIGSIEGDKFASSGLHGKLVNFSEEEPPKTFNETNGVFKNVTGDGVINAQYKFGNAFEFENKAKLIISYNELPYFKDTSVGMIRRLLIAPCEYDLEVVHKDKVNPNINEDLSRELSGIFNKALAGYLRLEAQKGFTKSQAVIDAVEEVHRYSDIVRGFISDTLIKTDDENDALKYSQVEDLFQSYFEEQNSSGKRLSKKAFSLRMKKYGFNTKKIKYNQKVSLYFHNIKVNSEHNLKNNAPQF